jgi:quercetin dioxygenase-like cupin family protein
MPSIERPLSGDILLHDLQEEFDQTADAAILERSGRNARTLIKSGPLRVTLVVLAPGGEISEHSADGPITIQPVEGSIRFTALGQVHEIGPGEVLSAGPGVPHTVASDGGGAFLLTLCNPVSSGDGEGPS